MRSSVVRAVSGALCSALAAGLGWVAVPIAVPTAAASPSSASATAQTSRVERKRVDSVATPELSWHSCYDNAQCATVRLPLDYDHPSHGTVDLALLRIRARDQKHRIGSLFVNPGGPGGSGTSLAYSAPDFLASGLLDRFDIVGFDPRGTNGSTRVQCFSSPEKQAPVVNALSSVSFPYTAVDERTVIKGAEALGRACSSTGKPLSASMSTAQVARDLEVLRRAVGDAKLSYLGFSYGSYLGEVYANLFPDRFRAIAIDGVVDPTAWAGTETNRNTPVSDRLRGADGAAKALHEILVRCDRAGKATCSFAPGSPVEKFEQIAERLKKHPLVETDPITEEEFTFGYTDLISTTLDDLYDQDGFDDITYSLTLLMKLTQPGSSVSLRGVQRASAVRALHARLEQEAERVAESHRLFATADSESYDNSLEAYDTVLCTDSLNPAHASSWSAAAAAADRRAPYFGREEVWTSAACASATWTAKDEDSYRGPFNRRTAATVLVVGSLWDPSTSFSGAVGAASTMPNSRLLTSDNWGHTAYGTSACATRSIGDYLLAQKLPAKGARCVGDVQPYAPTGGSARSRLQQMLMAAGPRE